MNLKRAVLALATTLAISGATFIHADSYIVMTNGNSISKKVLNAIEDSGATITSTIPQVGLIMVESDNEDFRSVAGRVAGVNTVFADLALRYIEPDLSELSVVALDAAAPPNTGDDDFFFDLQWGHTAIQATDAWALGQRGAGVRVAY